MALLLLFAAVAGTVQAQSVTVAWDPESGVTGYKVYQGGASRVYTNSFNTGAATQQTITGLILGKTYYFAVTAYNSSGVESDYSAEISYTAIAPTITLTSPASGASYSAPATIHLAATVVTNAHTINKVQFLSNGGVAAEVLAPPYATNLSNINAGVYSYSARLIYDGGSALNSTTASVTVTAGRPPLLAVLQLARLPGGMMNINGSGVPGHIYEVQASQNFKNWTVLGNVTADSTTGAISFTDPTKVLYSSRSYRLRDTTP